MPTSAATHPHRRMRWPAWLKPAADSPLAATLREGKPWWTDAVHVLWSAWVFTTPLFTPEGYSTRWLLLTLASYPLFLLLYFGTVAATRRVAIGCALGMAALATAMLPFGYASGMTYFVFGCVMLSMRWQRSLAWHVLALLLLCAAFIAAARWVGFPWQALVWLPAVVLIVGVIVQVDCMNKARDAALRLSQDEVRRLAATAERERIGRDLHDLLGHTLSMIAVKAELAGRLLERDPAAAQREIDAVAQVSRQALGEVRTAVSGIRSAAIAAEVASARLLLETEGTACEVSIDDLPLAVAAESALALALREAVTNVQRHARARKVQVSLLRRDDEAVLRVHDDGRGVRAREGNGLTGMRERLQAVGGRLNVDSTPGHGTCIEATVPLAGVAT